MASRLPTPGSDQGQWGQILNDFLAVEHNTDGTLKKAADIAAKYEKPSSGIPAGDLTSQVQTSLTKADASVQSVNAVFPSSGNVTITASDLASGTLNAARLPNSVLQKSTNSADAGKAVDAYSGAPLTVTNAAFLSINVKDYGAVGDGVTDDFDAIQNAINAAAANVSGNNIVKIPAGVYVLGKAGAGGLRLPANMKGLVIEGSGKGTTTIKLTKECLRCFDFWYVSDAMLFKNITLRNFTVDADNIGPLNVGPLTTLSSGSTIAGGSVYTTVNVGSNTAWASKGLLYIPSSSSGTAAGKRYPFRKTPSSSSSIDILNFGSAATLVSGDQIQGAVGDHVIVGTMFRASSDAAWNFRFDNIHIEDIEALNIPTIPLSALGEIGANFRGAVWLQPTSNPASPPATPMYATRIYVRRCEAWGGECGFAVGTYGHSPQPYSMFLDDIVFEDLKHSAMVPPLNNYTGENYIIGGTSYGNRAVIRRCWGEYSGDVGIETDALMDVTIEDCLIEDAAGGNFYSTNYNVPCRTIAGPPKTTISNGGSGITSGATSFTIAALPAGVAREGWVIVDSEMMRYSVTSSATVLNVVRAQGGSTAASHAEGAAVTFHEAHRQKLRYRRCRSRHSRQGVLSNGWMPKGFYQLANPWPQPPVSLKDCEWENTTPSMGLAPTYGGEAIYFYGENPSIKIDGFLAQKTGFAYTTLDARKGALIIVGRSNSTATEQTKLDWKNIDIRVSGDLASGASQPVFSGILFQPGSYILDWDSIAFDYYFRNAGAGATVAFDSGTNGNTLNGYVRRLRHRSRSGDAAPISVRIVSTAATTVNYLSFIDTDLHDFSYSTGSSDGNYRPFYIDATNQAAVTIKGTKHASIAGGSFARDSKHYVQTATNYTVLGTDEYVGVTSTAASRTITLPAVSHTASTALPKAMLGKRLTIKDESNGAGTNAITVTASGSETIDGSASKTIATNSGVLNIEAVPSGWVVV